MPVYVYPQGSTPAVSSIRRRDESDQLAAETQDLNNEQLYGNIGDTVPLVFCKRTTFEDADGNNVTVGGVWQSPPLIQFGAKNNVLSMLYLLSQGQLPDVAKSKCFYGAAPFNTYASGSLNVCTGYGEIPSCVSFNYTPGGTVSWDSSISTPGQSLSTRDFTYTSQFANCTAIRFTFNPSIAYTYSGPLLCGQQTKHATDSPLFRDVWQSTGTPVTTSKNAPTLSIETETNTFLLPNANYQPNQPGTGQNLYHWDAKDLTYVTDVTVVDGLETYSATTQYWLNKSGTRSGTTNAGYTWKVTNADTLAIVRTGTVDLVHGTAQTLAITGLPPAKYEFTMELTNPGWDEDSPYCGWTVNMYSWPYYGRYSDGQGYGMARNIFEACQFAFVALDGGGGYVASGAPGKGAVSGDVTVVETGTTSYSYADLGVTAGQADAAYDDVTVLGVYGPSQDIRPLDSDQFTQVHVFHEEGIQVKRHISGMQLGPSCNVADLVLYLMEEGKLLKSHQIDYQSLLYAARFTETNRLFYNGIIQTTHSFTEWIVRIAPYFLLQARQTDGAYGLIPVVPINAQYRISEDPVEPVVELTADDILQESFQRQYINSRDRRPICVIIAFRDQQADQPGRDTTIECRYPGTAELGPFEQHDLTSMCCDATHAAVVGRYILAKRRYVTHTVTMAVNRKGADLRPGDIVRVTLDIDTSAGKGLNDSTLYEVESVAEGADGSIELELLHFPVTNTGASLVGHEILSGRINIR